jgi:hypothetical protein
MFLDKDIQEYKMVDVLKKKKTIEERRLELKEKEKALMERERIYSKKLMVEIGKIAIKSNISHLDKDHLFGAFLDISEKAKNPKNLAQWKEISSKANEEEEKGKQIIISFKTSPTSEVKALLKNNKFKWNTFRGEYYGFGDKGTIENLFKNHECKIEVIV